MAHCKYGLLSKNLQSRHCIFCRGLKVDNCLVENFGNRIRREIAIAKRLKTESKIKIPESRNDDRPIPDSLAIWGSVDRVIPSFTSV